MHHEFIDNAKLINSINCKKLETLRSMSMTYVCENISLVDSFEGFPSEIAKEIFEKCLNIKFKDFTNNDEQSKIIDLFTEAYPDEFLTSCRMINSLITINEIDEQIPFLIKGLRSLDLSGCNLGDSHDVLPLLKTCRELKILSLADNDLTYKGLRAVFGINRKETIKLQCLDVSRNFSISHIGITSYVANIPSVQDIIVSAHPSKLSEWKSNLASSNFTIQKTIDNPEISNEGWAADLIEKWLNIGNSKTSLNRNGINTTYSDNLEKRKTAKCFYSGRVNSQNLLASEFKVVRQYNDYETYSCKRELKTPHTIENISKKVKHNIDDTEDEFLSMLMTYK